MRPVFGTEANPWYAVRQGSHAPSHPLPPHTLHSVSTCTMNVLPRLRPVSLLVAILLAAGCAVSPTPSADATAEKALSPELLRARGLFDQGRLSDAIVAVCEIARKDPLSPGLVELESDIMRTLSDARRSAADESASKIAA